MEIAATAASAIQPEADQLERAGLRRALTQWGAILFFVGIVTGLWAAAALTDTVKVGIPHLALAAHLNGLLGGLWMVAVAFSFDYLSYRPRGLRWLTWLVGIPCWGNWLVTVIASLLGVAGLDYNHDPSNNAIAAMLQAAVVIPGLVGSGMWAWGFRRVPRQ